MKELVKDTKIKEKITSTHIFSFELLMEAIFHFLNIVMGHHARAIWVIYTYVSFLNPYNIFLLKITDLKSFFVSKQTSRTHCCNRIPVYVNCNVMFYKEQYLVERNHDIKTRTQEKHKKSQTTF